MRTIYVIATTSIQKTDSILSKTVNIIKHFVRNKFLGQKLKTIRPLSEEYQRKK